ncbi:MAG TPA: hypothetical protein VFW02_00995 [Candidatus Limnocylindrales bacterium]|nr:hypothetical protein [Candidatus Limnocylindrales bacterium]
MTNKRIRLPKEGLVSPEELGPGEKFIDETDVEGHGWVNPAPPIDFSKGTPTHGGELDPGDATDED